MMRSMNKLLIAIILVTLSWEVARGQEITLYKKGITFTLSEDLHCMNNDTALRVSKRLKLCPKECAIRLEELHNLRALDTQTLKDKLVLQEKKYLSIISEKDKSIDKIQVAAIDEVSKIKNSMWWKVTLGVVTGLAVGAGVTALAMEYAR